MQIKNKLMGLMGRFIKAIIGPKKQTKSRIKVPINHEPRQLAREIIIGSFCIYMLLELLSNRSLLKVFLAPIENPLMFLCNVGMIAMTMSIGLLLPKRHIGYLLSSVFWLWLGSVNFILLGSRTTPLTAMDFKMLTSVFTVIGRYLSSFQLILFAVAMVILILSVLVVCIKLPRTKWLPMKGIIAIALAYAVMMLSFQMALVTDHVSRNFGNIAHAYLDYGFAYSFTTSVVDRGIQRPSTYSSKSIDDLVLSLKEKKANLKEPLRVYGHERLMLSDDLVVDPVSLVTEGSAIIEVDEGTLQDNPVEAPQLLVEEAQKTPNVIMVQLETFFDVKRLRDYTFNQDPTPNLTKLSEGFSSGYVTVPSIGAGTANTEFEILTGMSLDYFGAGEYPYKTILAKQTVESYAYDFSDIGYHAHALHNNMGTFYARHSVYPRLGFDGFTSIEYMEDVPYNPTGWAKDEVLIPEIIKVLDHTESADFVFAVSVQAHGKYPDEPLLEAPVIELTPTRWDDTLADEAQELNALDYQYLYFANQIYEVDKFMGDLVEALEDYPEPVVLVFYGDHLPTFEFDDQSLTGGTTFQTEYVIWDNMGLEEKDQDLMAYQLGSHVMGLLDYDNGIINKYHQTKMATETYEAGLELLQYDLLYGKKEAYGGVNPYERKKTSRGVNKAVIKDITHQGEALFVKGEYFTRWSEVFMDGVQVETIFIDSETLLIQLDALDPEATFKVSQMTKTGRKLSSTKKYKHIQETDQDLLEVIGDQLFDKMYQ